MSEFERIFDGVPVLGNGRRGVKRARKQIKVEQVEETTEFVLIRWGDKACFSWKPF